jgi:hypothetical protein
MEPGTAPEAIDHTDLDKQLANRLHTQLEDLLATVWNAEANWRFDDFLDLAANQRPPRRD